MLKSILLITSCLCVFISASAQFYVESGIPSLHIKRPGFFGTIGYKSKAFNYESLYYHNGNGENINGGGIAVKYRISPMASEPRLTCSAGLGFMILGRRGNHNSWNHWNSYNLVPQAGISYIFKNNVFFATGFGVGYGYLDYFNLKRKRPFELSMIGIYYPKIGFGLLLSGKDYRD